MELVDLLRALREQGGSDLHLVADSVPRLRVDGQLKPMNAAILRSHTVSRFAESLLTDEQQHQLAKDGEWDGAHTVPEVGRFRFHVYTQRDSLAMAVRAVSDTTPSLDQLGLPSVVKGLMQKSQGLVLVTGPTGSGKSTTLAAMLDHVNQERQAHIVSLEDPIEVLHAHKKSFTRRDRHDFPFNGLPHGTFPHVMKCRHRMRFSLVLDYVPTPKRTA